MLARMRGRIVDAAVACSVNLRSRKLRNAQAAFGVIWAGEWAATVAIGVVAFHHGGAAAVGLIGVARMIPASIVAPFASVIADRTRRELVLAWVGAARALALAVAAGVSAAGGPVVLVYVALVVATVAQTLFRPAHSALLPTLCTTPAELTSANVVRGLLDSTATLVGPLVAAVLLVLSGPAAVFLAAAVASLLAAGLALRVDYEAPPRLSGAGTMAPWRQTIQGGRAIGADRALVLLTGLAALQTFTRGALTVFLVVVAIKLVGAGQAGVGVLTAAIGAGAVVGSLSASFLVGRGGLARWFGLGVGLWGAPMVGIGALSDVSAAIALLAIVGLGNALVDVGVFTLLARRLMRCELPPGATVFEQGDDGDDFFVIERGQADVIGDGRPIRSLGPGDGFGEIALLRGCRRTTSVRATTALTLCSLSRSVFVRAVGGYSESATIAETVITDHLTRFSPNLGPD